MSVPYVTPVDAARRNHRVVVGKLGVLAHGRSIARRTCGCMTCCSTCASCCWPSAAAEILRIGLRRARPRLAEISPLALIGAHHAGRAVLSAWRGRPALEARGQQRCAARRRRRRQQRPAPSCRPFPDRQRAHAVRARRMALAGTAVRRRHRHQPGLGACRRTRARDAFPGCVRVLARTRRLVAGLPSMAAVTSARCSATHRWPPHAVPAACCPGIARDGRSLPPVESSCLRTRSAPNDRRHLRRRTHVRPGRLRARRFRSIRCGRDQTA